VTKRTNRSAADRDRASGFAESGRRFLEGANSEFELENWDSAALLFVHSGIAYADAVSVRRRGEKAAGENHADSVVLFGEATAGIPGRDEAVSHLRRLIEEKTRVSYIGTAVRKTEAHALRQHAERFQTFCTKLLGS
jgi:hypothetical protein